MGVLKKILFIFVFWSSNLLGQTFIYSYVDPCTKDLKTIFADASSPIMVVYYGQVKSFSYTDLQNGTFDVWMNTTYSQFQTTSPCQGAAITTTTTTSTNQVSNIITNIMALTNLDFSSLSTNTNQLTEKENGKSNNNTNSSSNGAQSSGSNSNTMGDVNGSQGQGSQGGGQVGGNSRNVSGNGGNGNSNSSSGGGSGNGGTTGEETKDKVVEKNQQTQNQITNSISKAKSETGKPAILLTGDIVGIQKTEDNSNDARATMSYTRVKGDGTASLGLTADFMFSAKIGNISGIRSWIKVDKKGHKHINLVSGQLGLLPKSITGTGLAIRVNSLNKFTALYGVAGTYGLLFEEPLINTLAIGGFMYKGKLAKSLDATVIAAGIYSPYMKYYTESVFKNKPFVIPFLNLNYKLTKTFGVGLTGGGTYVATQNVLNYQILLGARLRL